MTKFNTARECLSLYCVSPQEQPWRQRVFRRKMFVITHIFFSHVQKGTPGLTNKECVLQRVSLGALSRPGNKQGPLGQKAPIDPQVALVWIQLLMGDCYTQGPLFYKFLESGPWYWISYFHAWRSVTSRLFLGWDKVYKWRVHEMVITPELIGVLYNITSSLIISDINMQPFLECPWWQTLIP